MKLTITDHKVLALWSYPHREDRILSATEIGEELYGTDFRKRQVYARPGGKAALRLVRMGFLVRAAIEGRADGFVRKVVDTANGTISPGVRETARRRMEFGKKLARKGS